MSGPALAFDLVGNWTSSRILVRLLAVIASPWQVDEQGFVDRDSGARAHLAMGRPVPGGAELFASGTCPVRPSIDDALFAEIVGHKSVVSVSLPEGAAGPRDAFVLACAADAIVNAGALAVRCRNSGLAHGADAFQALVARARALAGGPDAALGEALYESFVLLRPGQRPPHTAGMVALGAPDIALANGVDPDRSTIRLEDLARALLRGELSTGEPVQDGLDASDPRHNPRGRLRIP